MICQSGNGYSVAVTKNGVRFNGRLYPFPPGVTNSGGVSVINGRVFVGGWEFNKGEWTQTNSSSINIDSTEIGECVTNVINKAMENMKETFRKLGW